MLCSLFFSGVTFGQEQVSKFLFRYKVPVVNEALFSVGVQMMGIEKNLYAEYLANYVAGELIADPVTQQKLELAAKCMALGLHLSPENRRLLAVHDQLKKQSVTVVAAELGGETLASLFVERAAQLRLAEGEKHRVFAQALFSLSREMDPKNQKAEEALKTMNEEYGAMDWSVLLGW